MKKQIVQVSPYQTAKVMAGLYFVLSLPAMFIAACVLSVVPYGGVGMPMVVLALGLYLLGMFLGTALAAWLYNLVAARLGGFEFTTKDVEPAAVR